MRDSDRLFSIEKVLSQRDGDWRASALHLAGRLPRMEFFTGNLLIFIAATGLTLVVYFLYNLCGRPFTCAYALSPLFAAYLCALAVLFVLALGLRVRRFHDFGLSGLIAFLTSSLWPLFPLAWLLWSLLPTLGSPFHARRNLSEWLGGAPLLLLILAATLFLVPALIPGSKSVNRYDLGAKN